MNAQQARNVVALLQKDPFYYRNFGVWWWHIKNEIRRHGFTKDQLPHAGTFSDPSVEKHYEGKTTEALDNEAYEHQYMHTFHKYNNNHTFTPDGEVYVVQDQDVE